jgi:hypothetical protein
MMSQHWTRYIEDWEYEESREYVKDKKKKKQKLTHEQEQKLKESKKNGTKYPKKPKH